MIYPVAFLCLFAYSVHGEKPFEVFDITTLVRLNETEEGLISPSSETKETWTPDFPNSVYEVHSRTDAISIQTNFEDVTGIQDQLQNSELTCADATVSSLCKDWVFEGFEDGTWSIIDPFLDWRPIQHDYYDKRFMKNNNTLETSQRNIFGYTMTYFYPKGKRTMFFDEIKVRFRPHNPLFFACPCRGTSDIYLGVEISPSRDLNSSTSLHGQSTEYNRNPKLTNINVGRKEISGPDYVETALLTRNSMLYPDSLLLVVGYQNVSEAKKFILSKFSNSFRVVPYSLDSIDYEVYKTVRPKSKRLIGKKGTVISPVISDTKNKLCLFMRFLLNGTINWKLALFSPINGVEGPSISVNFEGVGLLYTKKFVIPLTQELQNSSPTRLRISFETNCTKCFTLRSFRKCSGDADVLFVLPSQLKDRSTRPAIKSPSTAQKGFSKLRATNVGFGIKSYQKAFPSKNPMKKCYNGGINVEEWCQCLPGYKGSTCEEACAPYQFGSDCGGVCNPIGSLDCKGILLAGPGLPLECARGYTGVKCDTECKPGHYGPDCKLQCGQCASGICDRFSGKCDGPCRRGYTKDSCQDQFASLNESPVLTNIGEDYVDGYVRFEEPLDLYPVLKILYKKEGASTWSSKLFPMTTGRNFTITKLEQGEKYLLRAIPVHKDMDYYDNPYEKPLQIFTKCDDSRFEVKASLINKALLVEWELGPTHHPCTQAGYKLEIRSPELLEPYVVTVSPNATTKSIEPVFLKEGSVRLKLNHDSNQSKWSDPVPFQQLDSDVGDTDSLKIKFVTSTRLDFQWTNSKGVSEDILSCESSRILCEGNHNSSLEQRVKPGAFSIDGLNPFTRYTCALKTTKLVATTATKPDVPFVAPRNRLESPVSSITDSKATLQWEDITNCTNLNAIFEGFVVELWDGNELKITSKKKSDNNFSIEFSNLTADTSYEARVFLVNTVGLNREKYASVLFQTTSKAPDAVTNLLAYKRTRSSLWLRWLPPKTDPNIVKYRIVVAALGVETKSEEIPPKPCDIWPDFVCYKVEGLTPVVEYNVTVEAQNGIVRHYGPASLTRALTKETEPEAPEGLHVVEYTPHSIMLGWQVPVVLNSDPKFFVVTLDQVDAYNNEEQTTVSTQMTVHLSENIESYQLQVDDLNCAASYVMTVSAGNRGARAAINVHTPPEQPQAPRTPTVSSDQIIARGVEGNGNSSVLLSGYLVLVSTNSVKQIVFDAILDGNLRKKIGDFTVVEELPSNLDEVTVVLSESRARRGRFSLIEKKSFEPGQNYQVAVAAISAYRGALSAALSPIVRQLPVPSTDV